MGQTIESRVARILESMGFRVSKNIKLRGRTGIHRQPDFTFEVEGKTFIVECKNRFSRADIISVYGMATDLNVNHVLPERTLKLILPADSRICVKYNGLIVFQT